MTSSRWRINDRRRGHRGGHWRKDASLIVLFTVGCAVLAVVDLAARIWPLVVVGLLAVVAYCARRARHVSRPLGVNQGRAAEVGQLQAELSEVRRQVADLEDAAGRPIDAITATYQHLQRQYGPAAAGKTGGRP